MSASQHRVAIVGAGVGGLVAAIECAARGMQVDVFEGAGRSGGKVRVARIGDHAIDQGPTVFTMREVFDQTLDRAGFSLDDLITLERPTILARHFWRDHSRLDLFADAEQSEHAIEAFAGSAEANRFRQFRVATKRMFDTLDPAFMRAARTDPLGLVARIGRQGPAGLTAIRPFAKMWQALGRYFHDPRLRQLFARYATYCGSSPFESPATLMLIAHAEARGVWMIQGGMIRLADGLERVARHLGVSFHFGCAVRTIDVLDNKVSGVQLATGESIGVDAIVCNADATAISNGSFGSGVRHAVADPSDRPRSLSAVTWALLGSCNGFPLHHHNVFFSNDYRAEFDDLFGRRQLTDAPTVYLCAQDRNDDAAMVAGSEPLFCLINAPATGDSPGSIDLHNARDGMLTQLTRCGLDMEFSADEIVATGPADFHALYPGTGGALYGRATHGWRASFVRPGSRTRLAGLYLAGGSIHPGAGLPMAAISGQLAARSIVDDYRTPRH